MKLYPIKGARHLRTLKQIRVLKARNKNVSVKPTKLGLWSDQPIITNTVTKPKKRLESKLKKKKGVFRYYTAYIMFGKTIFRVTLNLFSDANGTRLYDINKITQITASGTVHGSSGYKYCKPQCCYSQKNTKPQ